MALHYLLVEDTTGKASRGNAVPTGGSAAFTDYDFTVGAGGQTVFSGLTFSSGQAMDVLRNGSLVREGATNDWTRTGTTAVTFNYTVLANAWVKVRVWT